MKNEFLTQAPYTAAKKKWRTFTNDRESSGNSTEVIAVAATFTVDGLVPMLGSALLDLGRRPEILLAPYNQLFQTCLEHATKFGKEPNTICLLWRIEDLLAKEFDYYVLQKQQTALDAALTRIDELLRAIRQLRASFGGTIVVGLPPFAQGVTPHILDLSNLMSAGAFYRLVTDRFLSAIATVESIRIIDLDALQRDLGMRSSYDARKWYLYKQPYTESFLFEAGKQIARIVFSNMVAPKKCVVVDCDNTLWGGVVGEDGVCGIQLGGDFPGAVYSDIQKFLRYLRAQGTLLAIASKNNEADVWEVFDRHDGMILSRNDISAWRINWKPKPQNVMEIAAELNIGTDSIVFIDDSAHEIEQMRQYRPDVVSIHLDGDPAHFLGQLSQLHLFDVSERTQEDSQRSAMISTERERAATLGQVTPEQFVAMLGLNVELATAELDEFSRVAQLINKTNQFNLSTKRRTADDLKGMVGRNEFRIYRLRVSDKFGDYGLVGVALIRDESKGYWLVDTLLLSCRVLGRSVETAFLYGLGREAEREGVCQLVAEFASTSKNAPAKEFLVSHGFAARPDGAWQLNVESIPPYPKGIRLEICGSLDDRS
jgi:FkbH-like protein